MTETGPASDKPRVRGEVTAASLARDRERRKQKRALLAIKYDLAAGDLTAIQAEGFHSHREATIFKAELKRRLKAVGW